VTGGAGLQLLEDTFECEDVGSNGAKIAEEFNVGVVQEIVDCETYPERRTELDKIVGSAQIDDFHGNPLIAVDDRRQPHQVFINALNA